MFYLPFIFQSIKHFNAGSRSLFVRVERIGDAREHCGHVGMGFNKHVIGLFVRIVRVKVNER